MAINCPNCNFAGNIDAAEKCQQCNTPLDSKQPETRAEDHTQGNDRAATSEKSEQHRPLAGETERRNLRTINENQLIGRITWFETTNENIDFNYYRFFSQLILFIMQIKWPRFLIRYSVRK